MLAGVGVHGEDGMRGRPRLCLMCIRRFVCLLVSHPCCIVCVFHLLRFVGYSGAVWAEDTSRWTHLLRFVWTRRT